MTLSLLRVVPLEKAQAVSPFVPKRVPALSLLLLHEELEGVDLDLVLRHGLQSR